MQRLASPLVAEKKIFLSKLYVFLLVMRALASVVFRLGGFLLHHRPFPICRLACCDLLFVGLALVVTLDTDLRSLFPCLYRR